jgi:hypothetical protein
VNVTVRKLGRLVGRVRPDPAARRRAAASARRVVERTYAPILRAAEAASARRVVERTHAPVLAAAEAVEAERASAEAELARIEKLPPRIRRRVTRLVARCPHNEPVCVVYATGDGRMLVDFEFNPRNGFNGRPGMAWWLYGPGDTWAAYCRRSRYQVSAARLLALVPDSGTRNVGVSMLSPSSDVPLA